MIIQNSNKNKQKTPTAAAGMHFHRKTTIFWIHKTSKYI